jgi:excisionase family DNA binding protein
VALRRWWRLPCFMSTAEVAGMLQLTVRAVRRMLRDGELIGYRHGGPVGWRLPRAYVHFFAEQQVASAFERAAESLAHRDGRHLPPHRRGDPPQFGHQ